MTAACRRQAGARALSVTSACARFAADDARRWNDAAVQAEQITHFASHNQMNAIRIRAAHLILCAVPFVFAR
jgi:hypothetical protein